ncbi:MAG: FAD-binding oxidoreductase [Acidimicrobiia bacterium]
MTMLATWQSTAGGTRLTPLILEPGDPGFDDVALPWNRAHRHSPAFVGIPESAADVVELVQFAKARGLTVGVQATGHGVARPVTGGLLILTHRLDSVDIDPDASVCRLGAGVQWGPVLEAAQKHGLAPLLGSSPNVGAVGYTLGGGLGWLARLHGLASDSVVSFEVVTVDGRLMRVSAEENPELFWGLRGGGAGSLVIVTSMEVRMFEVSTVYGGNLLYPAEMGREVLARWRDWIPTVPNELSSSVVTKTFPAFDHIPAHLRGRSFVMVRGCYAGDPEAGERLLAYWRHWRRPEIDDWKTMPFTEVATIAGDPVNPSAGRMSGGWLREFSDHAIEVLVTHTLETPNSS